MSVNIRAALRKKLRELFTTNGYYYEQALEDARGVLFILKSMMSDPSFVERDFENANNSVLAVYAAFSDILNTTYLVILSNYLFENVDIKYQCDLLAESVASIKRVLYSVFAANTDRVTYIKYCLNNTPMSEEDYAEITTVLIGLMYEPTQGSDLQ